MYLCIMPRSIKIKNKSEILVLVKTLLDIKKSVKITKGGNQNPYIQEEQTTQWPNEKVQKDKQRSTKHTYKTKYQVTRTPITSIYTTKTSPLTNNCFIGISILFLQHVLVGNQ